MTGANDCLFWEVLDAVEDPGLGAGPRPAVWSRAQIEQLLEQVTLRQGAIIHALLLLWHDPHEVAHKLVQDFAGGSGAFVHGILHRRRSPLGWLLAWGEAA